MINIDYALCQLNLNGVKLFEGYRRGRNFITSELTVSELINKYPCHCLALMVYQTVRTYQNQVPFKYIDSIIISTNNNIRAMAYIDNDDENLVVIPTNLKLYHNKSIHPGEDLASAICHEEFHLMDNNSKSIRQINKESAISFKSLKNTPNKTSHLPWEHSAVIAAKVFKRHIKQLRKEFSTSEPNCLTPLIV